MAAKIVLFLQCMIIGQIVFSQSINQQVRSPYYPVDTFPVIYEMMGMVDTSMVVANIQHMQDYGTRNATKPQAIQAQNWIKGHFENYGLSVEIQDFPMGGNSSSDNVLGTWTGKVTPDEFVIIGGHYDSYAWGNQEPGADDNASGTAGVMEVARILSQFEFERSIVFCAFSGEEYGMYGSEAYAARAEQDQMNILGYVNLDMISYNYPGDMIHTDMIAPPSAKELSDYYKAVSAIYLPDFMIYDAMYIPGGSDHVSFNNHGYMGIFPCEEDQNYSPFIHTANDLIGPSVNSLAKAEKFIQAALATVVSLAVPYDPVGQPEITGITDPIRLYPNPANDKVFVESVIQGPALLTVYTITGQKVMSNSVSGNYLLDVSGLKAGSYIVNITGKDFTSNKKLLVR